MRRIERQARPIDGPMVVFVAALVPLLLVLGMVRYPGDVRTILVSLVTSVAWIGVVMLFRKKYPDRDKIDMLERREIDGMIRIGIEDLLDSIDTDRLKLDREDVRELVQLYEGQTMPAPVRQLILRPIAESEFPDI